MGRSCGGLKGIAEGPAGRSDEGGRQGAEILALGRKRSSLASIADLLGA